MLTLQPDSAREAHLNNIKHSYPYLAIRKLERKEIMMRSIEEKNRCIITGRLRKCKKSSLDDTNVKGGGS